MKIYSEWIKSLVINLSIRAGITSSAKVNVAPISLNQDQLLNFELISQAKKIPVKGSIELLYKCNLNCIHCYIPEEFKKSKELSFEEICHITG